MKHPWELLTHGDDGHMGVHLYYLITGNRQMKSKLLIL